MAQKEYVKKDYREIINNKVTSLWNQGRQYTVPWERQDDLPYNPMTGTIYRGINYLSCMLDDRSDPRYFTIPALNKLSEELGLKKWDIHVEKGAEGIPVMHMVDVIVNKERYYKEKQLREIGLSKDEIYNKTKDIGDGPSKISTMAYLCTAFNAEVIKGSEHLPRVVQREVEPIPALERMILAMQADGLTYKFLDIDKAYYRPDEDTVYCPNRDRFKSDLLAARTIMHETIHATGHKNRLNRESIYKYHDSIEVRAEEELVAEFGSIFTGSELGLGYDRTMHDNHIAYTEHFAKMVEHDKHALFRGVGRADKATEYVKNKIIELEKSLELKNEQENKIKLPRPEKTIILPSYLKVEKAPARNEERKFEHNM